jgi:hypothetical protein
MTTSAMARRLGSALLYILAVSAGLCWYNGPLARTCCLLRPMFAETGPRSAGFFRYSNFDQRVLSFPGEALVDTDTDDPQWRAITCRQEEGRLRIRLTLSDDLVMFYPRLMGANSSIAVYDVHGSMKHLLYRQQGSDDGWTPLGQHRQFRLCQNMDREVADNFSMDLEIVLQGPGAQLWHKGDWFFF